jgi:plastocyanin
MPLLASRAAARPAFDLRIPIGQSRAFKFTLARTYLVTCLIHPSMNMTIVVR